MSIQAGEKMPAGSFGVMTADGPGSLSTDELFAGKKVVLVSVPGAFTPTCSKGHKEKGLDIISSDISNAMPCYYSLFRPIAPISARNSKSYSAN